MNTLTDHEGTCFRLTIEGMIPAEVARDMLSAALVRAVVSHVGSTSVLYRDGNTIAECECHPPAAPKPEVIAPVASPDATARMKLSARSPR